MGKEAIKLVVTFLLLAGGVLPVMSQRYSVASFRKLDTDVSAFINPVKDLNGDGCALLKIEAPVEFAFSTPLGVVKREEKTGEIWLYVPAGTKKMTFKHPQWGVLRNYIFPEKMENFVTYEIRLALPPGRFSGTVQTVRDTVVRVERDTVTLIARDTVVVAAAREKIPFALTGGVSVLYGGRAKSLAPGIMFFAMKRHGGWAHVSSDFRGKGSYLHKSTSDGYVSGVKPFYSGKTSHSVLTAVAGPCHRLSGKVTLFEGAGYGWVQTRWQLAESEGSGWVENSGYTREGFAAEVGAKLELGRFSAVVSVLTLKGKDWFGSVGVGYSFRGK